VKTIVGMPVPRTNPECPHGPVAWGTTLREALTAIDVDAVCPHCEVSLLAQNLPDVEGPPGRERPVVRRTLWCRCCRYMLWIEDPGPREG
jgi:hypothetical protein